MVKALTEKTGTRGISFSAIMARAVHEGLKTQTRRAVRRDKPAPYQAREVLYVKEPVYKAKGGRIAYTADDLVTPRRWPWKPAKLGAMYMPHRLRRAAIAITAVRRERLHGITEADAIAEGFTPEVCAAVFDMAAGRTRVHERVYVERKSDGCVDWFYCERCATAEARRLTKEDGEEWVTAQDGGPSDLLPYCQECGRVLDFALTKEGVDSLLWITSPCVEEYGKAEWAMRGANARATHSAITHQNTDLRPEHHGRLAQVGFATLFDIINGKGSWASNPEVHVYTFKRVA